MEFPQDSRSEEASSGTAQHNHPGYADSKSIRPGKCKGHCLSVRSESMGRLQSNQKSMEDGTVSLNEAPIYILAGVGGMVVFVFAVLFLPILLDFYNGWKAGRARHD